MRFWITIAAWTLAPFGAVGLLFSLIVVSVTGVVINVIVIAIGIHDIIQLRRVEQEPQRWRYLAATQAFIGLLIGGLLVKLGLGVAENEAWKRSEAAIVDMMRQLTAADTALIKESMANSLAIMEWGLVICGVLLLLSQLWIAYRAYRLANAKPMPPPLQN